MRPLPRSGSGVDIAEVTRYLGYLCIAVYPSGALKFPFGAEALTEQLVWTNSRLLVHMAIRFAGFRSRWTGFAKHWPTHMVDRYFGELQ